MAGSTRRRLARLARAGALAAVFSWVAIPIGVTAQGIPARDVAAGPWRTTGPFPTWSPMDASGWFTHPGLAALRVDRTVLRDPIGDPTPALPASHPRARELLASALLPGTGQLLSGRDRGWVLLGVDALLLSGWWIERSAGRSDRDGYRDLAWSVARSRVEPRRDGDWEYYERMAKWESSGAFDAVPQAPGVQPEVRPETFNGDAWRLASALFLEGGPGTPGTAAWDAAIEWYGERAYADDLLWDWAEDPAARERYRDLIEASDDHMRRAGWAAAAAVGLRVVAVLDLWVASRSSGRAGVDLELRADGRLEPSLRLHPFGLLR